MIGIGEMPILWHIMKGYSHYGFDEFIICCGYKAHMIKEYFASYYLHRSDVTFDFGRHNDMTVHHNVAEQWKVTLVDTGLPTMTGGRLLRVRKYLDDQPFMMTYGDGVSDVDLKALLAFHQKSGKMATLTAVTNAQRFGILDIDESGLVHAFREKSMGDTSKINAGFMVLQPEIFDLIEGDQTVFEKKPLEQLVEMGQLAAYPHHGFWQCMDTQRDKHRLEELWKEGRAPWKVWTE